jgi:hypothetical protein
MSLALLTDGGSSRERAGPRVILDRLGVSVTTEESTAEYPTATGAGMRPTAVYAATLARRKTASAAVAAVTSDLDENLPASVLRHLNELISAHTARD